MNHKDQIVVTPDVRKAMDQLKMEMVRQAQVNIKNIFPSLGFKSEKVHHTKSLSHTRKGSGRKHQQGK
jgi:hypothetical protein